jgi:hypothetical protein
MDCNGPPARAARRLQRFQIGRARTDRSFTGAIERGEKDLRINDYWLNVSVGKTNRPVRRIVFKSYSNAVPQMRQTW